MFGMWHHYGTYLYFFLMQNVLVHLSLQQRNTLKTTMQEFSIKAGTIVDQYKVLKQAGVCSAHIKLQLNN